MSRRAKSASEASQAAAATPAAARAEALPRASSAARWAWPLVVALVAVLVYANTVDWGFTWDDQWLILDNPRIEDPSYITYKFTGQRWWRPLEIVSFMADYHLSKELYGKARARNFHVTNIALQAGACVALYFLILSLSRRRTLAGLTALLFATHPIHVEAVACITHRNGIMALLFSLLGFLAYLRARDGDDSSTARVLLLIGAGLCYLLGMWSKEVSAVMLPALIVVYEVALRRDWTWSVKALEGLVLRLVPFAWVVAAFTWNGYVGTLHKRFSKDTIEWITESKESSYAPVFLTSLKAFAWDLGALFWPHPLYLDRVFTLPTSAADPHVLLGLLAVAAFTAASLIAWRVSRLAFFALAWCGLNLLPVSNLIPLTHWLVAERFLYVPSVGFALLTALAFEALWEGRLRFVSRSAARAVVAGMVPALLVVYAGKTVAQNHVWENSTRLWQQTLKYNAKSYRALYGFGLELYNAGETKSAEPYYRDTVKVNPSYPEAHYALALLLLNDKRYEEAIKEGEIHAGLARKDPEPCIIIGNARFNQRDYEGAVKAYARAVERAPKHFNARYNLGNSLLAVGRAADALVQLDAAVMLDETADIEYMRGQALEQLRKPDDALKAYDRAAAMDPRATEALNAAASLLVRQQRLRDAAARIRLSLAREPAQPKWAEFLAKLPVEAPDTSAEAP